MPSQPLDTLPVSFVFVAFAIVTMAYGDPGDDAATFEVQVFYLLAGGGHMRAGVGP